MADQIISPNATNSPFYLGQSVNVNIQGPNLAYTNLPPTDEPVYLLGTAEVEVHPIGDYFIEGGRLPEYKFEGGEFEQISYAFDNIRLVPNKTVTGERIRLRIGNRVINGSWNLVGDLHLKVNRYVRYKPQPVLDENGQEVEQEYTDFEEIAVGVVAPNIQLATSKLVYRNVKCSQSTNLPDGIEYEWYFEVDEIEKLDNLKMQQLSFQSTNETTTDENGETVPVRKSVKILDRILNDVSLGDDSCWIVGLPNGGLEEHKRPITQHIVWANHKRKSITIGQAQIPTFVLEPPLRFYSPGGAFEISQWTGKNNYIYYGTSTPSPRGNDTILIARLPTRLGLDTLPAFDKNWINFNEDRKKTFFEMYVSFIDENWTQEMGTPDFKTTGKTTVDPITGKTILVREKVLQGNKYVSVIQKKPLVSKTLNSQGLPAFPPEWQPVYDEEVGPLWVLPFTNADGKFTDKDGNILIPGRGQGNHYYTFDTVIGGAAGCPPTRGFTFSIWKETDTGIVIEPSTNFRFAEEGLEADAYAKKLAYIQNISRGKRLTIFNEPDNRLSSLNEGFIVPRGRYDDARRFFQPNGATPTTAIYFFRDIRFVPQYDVVRNNKGIVTSFQRSFKEIGNKIIPGPWNLIADLYMYTNNFVGILYPDYVLSDGELSYTVERDCDTIYNWNRVDYEYRFHISEIETLTPLYRGGFSNHAANILNAVTPGITNRRYFLGSVGYKPGDTAADTLTKQYENSYEVAAPRISLIDHIMTQNAFEMRYNPDNQPYRRDNERYWSFTYGTLPVLIDNEVKGIFGDLKRINASKPYVISNPIKEFPNYVIGSTPCTQSWDFRKVDGYVPRNPLDSLRIDIKDCEQTPFELILSKKPVTKEVVYNYGDYVNISYEPIVTRAQTSRSPVKTRDPQSPCYEGFKTEYEISEYYHVTHSKLCWETVTPAEEYDDGVVFDGLKFKKYVAQYSQSLQTTVYPETKWEEPSKTYCDCIEVKILGKPFIDPEDACECTEITIDNVYQICIDDGLYYYENQKVPPGKQPIRTEIRYRDTVDCDVVGVNVFKKFNPEKDIIFAKPELNAKGLFGGKDNIKCYMTSSLQPSSSKNYYYSVVDCDECLDDPFFAVSYGNKKGSGSKFTFFEEEDSPSRAMYSQFRLLALDQPETQFEFYKNGTLNANLDDVYAINFYRDSLLDKIDPGNIEISFAELNGKLYANHFYTGSNVQVSSSNKIITLIDSSNDLKNQTYCLDSPYESYDLVSGSLVNGIHDSGTGSIETNPNITTYGKVYPSLGMIIFDAQKLNDELGFNTVTGSNIAGDNSYKIFTSISGAASLGYPMRARSSSEKTVTEYFVRLTHKEFNYSNNPTYANYALYGKINKTCSANEPVTYITTVGLYNDSHELLAVGKISRPIKKSSYDDVSLKIRLSI